MVSTQDFVETKIVTKFATFNVRVYSNASGKETLVLWTDNLDRTHPVLVRVHSECLTGDMLGSLHCDCGKQLEKSLQIIGKEGGVLIYLRQEGRGIGLFEKIKTYQLQSKGYDTVEANILLGHQPDARSYEMVKKALDDLNIKCIRLLTNNPSKLSEIAKLGIEVVERVPLISRANKHNKSYLETKRKKFQHFLTTSSQKYFYQFHVSDSHCINPIAEFIKNKKKDPLLEISVGIAAKHDSLTNKDEIKRISSIIEACDNQPGFSPAIHFSFRDSGDPLKDVLEIKKIWPQIKRLQINDLKALNVGFLQEAGSLFLIDIPLSDENFDIIHKQQFRNFVKENKSLIILDNSKGRGIKESKEHFFNKIDQLLAYGLNNIGLCGGFGPDELDIYFEIKRFYKINFSIDAETKVKTDGKTDIEKVKLYLFQLIRFDDPKLEGIEQTKRFLKQHCRSDWEKVKINEYEFLIHSKVFHAGHFPSTAWFASELCELVKNDNKFCEVGCGSGVISCLVALSNQKLQVTATDINQYATENTKVNARLLGLEPRIKALTGDVLDSIVTSESGFDSIFWALPFGFLDPGTHISLEEIQVFDPGYRSIRKFLKTAKDHLKPKGKLFIGFSSDLGHFELLETLAAECSIKLVKIREKVLKEESGLKFEIFEGKFL